MKNRKIGQIGFFVNMPDLTSSAELEYITWKGITTAVAAIEDSTFRVGWDLVGVLMVFSFGHHQLSSWSSRYCGS